MKLPADTVISSEKVIEYLLKQRPESDKSKFLALAGYDVTDSERLIIDLREQILPLEALFQKRTRYGDVYEIRGTLTGQTVCLYES